MSDQPEEGRSSIKLFKADVSVRGWMAILCTAALCGLSFLHPDLFSKAFESISIAIVAFYFGQNSKR